MPEDIKTMVQVPSDLAGRRDLPMLFQHASAAHQAGQLGEAEKLYDAILRIDSRHFDAMSRIGVIRLQQERYDEAEFLFRRAVKLNEQSPEAHHHLAVALTRLGQLNPAIGHFERAVGLRSRFAEALDGLGFAQRQLGRIEEAIANHKKSLAANPFYPTAGNNLGLALHAAGRFEEAAAAYRDALKLRPQYAEAQHNLGLSLAALDRHEEAVEHFERSLSLQPSSPHAHISLGNTLVELKSPDRAMDHYEKALALAPDDAVVYARIGRQLRDLTHQAGAEEQADLAIRAAQSAQLTQLSKRRVDETVIAQNHHMLAALASELSLADRAVDHCRKALALTPDDPDLLDRLGVALRDFGQLAEAERAFRQAIAQAPRRGSFYWNLALSHRFSADDDEFQRMVEQARDLDSLDDESRMSLHFALGKALADIGDHEQSFAHLIKGNALRRTELGYDEAEVVKRFERVRGAFTADVMREKAGYGDPSTVPVFIIGMQRSGTTLVEQMLASHPKAFGAGELADLGRIGTAIKGVDGTEFPEAVATLSAENLRDIGSKYVRRVRRMAPQAERIIDKMPDNFLLAGLVPLILPNARIIHMRRDPRDTAVSNFSILFGGGLRHTYELGELGRYIRHYQRLMEHWRRVLPTGIMLEVDYDLVVGSFEAEARRIVAHCGLAWDDACLAFHKSKRVVRTASVAQVRKPIYASSLNRWRRYEKHLKPLLDALNEP
jgi:tetratricopeptide (TPR) repeat protein